MDEPDYLIINPLQIELNLVDNTNEKIKNEKNLNEIEERFNNKMEKLKNISLQNKQLKYIIQNINHRLILIDL